MSLPISSHSLTPLDHLLVPSYRSPVSTFDLKGKDRDAALSRLEVATARLVSHLPFLGASVAPYADPDGRVNTFGVYNATDDTIPFYELQEHAQFTPLLIDGDLNPELMPSVGHLQPSDPCPVMRLKANVVGDMLYLVHCFYHRAMDGMSLSIVTKVLAQLCCDPDTPAKDLATSAAEQEDMRTHLAELGVSSEPQSLRWEPKPSYHPLSNTTDYRNIPVNRQYLMRAERVRQIQQACQVILQEHVLNKGKKVHLSTSLIMGAVFGICSHRARRAAGLGELYGSRFHAFFNIRSLLGLPSTYIGNALVMIGCSLDAQILPSIEAHLTHFASGLAASDVQRVCNVALALLQEIQAYTPDHVAGMMGTLNTLEDWSSAAPPCDALRFSDMHKMEIYYDFGPLGVTQDFALAEHKVAGASWVLPDRPQQRGSKGPGYYDLQVGLERAAMEELEKDQLFQWVTGTGPSKSKL